MAELQIPNYMTSSPLSVADLYDITDKTRMNQQAMKMNEMKMAEAEQNNELQNKTNQLQYQSTAHALGSKIATDIVGKVQAMGIDPSAPDFQQKLDQVASPYRPLMASAMNQPDNGQPIHWESLMALKGLTAQEQGQADIQQKLAEKQVLFPMELQIAQARAEAMRPPVNYQTIERPEGTYRLNPQTGESGLVGGIPGKMNEPKPLQEWQRKNIDFGTRMSEANDIITEIGKNYNPEAVKIAKGLEDIPLAGYATNALISPKDQQIIQAQRQFVNSVLRPESGASISPAEFENAAKQYFPQPNDTDETIARKEQARQTAIEGLMVGIPREYMPKSKMPAGDENIQVDIQHPEKLSEEDKRLLQSDINQEKNKPKGKLKFMGFE